MKTFKIFFLLLFIVACKNENSTEDINSDISEQLRNESVTSNNLKLLQGTWQNTVDTLSIIKINGSLIENFYAGKSAKAGVKISLGNTCLEKSDPNRKPEKDRYISITGEFKDCYYITKLDKENLILNFLNGGFDLTFKRL